jgi:hypothetical protein
MDPEDTVGFEWLEHGGGEEMRRVSSAKKAPVPLLLLLLSRRSSVNIMFLTCMMMMVSIECYRFQIVSLYVWILAAAVYGSEITTDRVVQHICRDAIFAFEVVP